MNEKCIAKVPLQNKTRCDLSLQQLNLRHKMNVVPKKLVGAWARESYQLVGSNACETSKVIWLQTGSRYADIRINLPEFSDKPAKLAMC